MQLFLKLALGVLVLAPFVMLPAVFIFGREYERRLHSHYSNLSPHSNIQPGDLFQSEQRESAVSLKAIATTKIPGISRVINGLTARATTTEIPASTRAFRPISLYPRGWWGQGMSIWAGDPPSLHSPPNTHVVLRWNGQAAKMLSAFWLAVQHQTPRPREDVLMWTEQTGYGGEGRATKSDNETCAVPFAASDQFVEQSCANYGLFSLVRDTATLFLGGVLTNITVVSNPAQLAACKPYCTATQANGSDTHLGCLFETLAPCRLPPGGAVKSPGNMNLVFGLPTGNYGLPDMPEPLWTRWVEAGAVWWETVQSQAAGIATVVGSNAATTTPPPPRTATLSPRAAQPAGVGRDFVVAAQRTMLRGLLLNGVLWRPRPAVQRIAAQLERTLGLLPLSAGDRGRLGGIDDVLSAADATGASAEQSRKAYDRFHPMLVLMARRTDKAKDAGIYTRLRAGLPGGQLPIAVYGKLAAAAERSAGVQFRSVLLMTDDVGVWRNRSAISTHLARGERVRWLANPYWDHVASLLPHDWLVNSHDALNVDTAVSRYAFHAQLLADIIVAGRHGDYMVGCGLSAVHQTVVQLVGARLGMDPAWRTLWEEDYLPVVLEDLKRPLLAAKKNVTQKAGNGTWATYDNINSVFGMTALNSVKVNFNVPSAAECEGLCKRDAVCRVWVWHAPTAFGGFALQCWFRLDGVFVHRSESAHVSGCRADVPECLR